MNQEEKTHWTQDKILLYVKACMSATGLTRMPSRSELSEYYGNDKLTNAIRRFPGGYYKIAEILNVEMKESETQFGKYGEDLATKLLEEHGFAVERMSTRYAYDLYVNGSVKVDVKTAELFAWQISDLKVYDTPRNLDEFSRFGFFGMGRSNCVCGNWRCENYEPSDSYMEPPTCKIEGCSIYRAPQSWCYVEELHE